MNEQAMRLLMMAPNKWWEEVTEKISYSESQEISGYLGRLAQTAILLSDYIDGIRYSGLDHEGSVKEANKRMVKVRKRWAIRILNLVYPSGTKENRDA